MRLCHPTGQKGHYQYNTNAQTAIRSTIDPVPSAPAPPSSGVHLPLDGDAAAGAFDGADALDGDAGAEALMTPGQRQPRANYRSNSLPSDRHCCGTDFSHKLDRTTQLIRNINSNKNILITDG